METTDRLNQAAQIIRDDEAADELMRAVGAWLRAEAATQEMMEPLADLLSVAIESAGGPKAYLSVGKRADGEIEMQSSTNEHALAVADAVLSAYS